MKSRSKSKISDKIITRLLKKAGLSPVHSISPLGEGEFNSLYSCDTDQGSYVLKIAPFKESTLLTYEQEMMKQELYFYSLIQEHTTIKTPRIIFSDFSKTLIPSPYFIMEKVNGIQLDKLQVDETQKGELNLKIADLIAQIHRLRHHQFGYLQNGLHDNWFLAISSMSENLIKDAKKFHHSSKRGKILLHYIHQYRSILEKVESRLVNYDIWPGNILCELNNQTMAIWLIDLERCFFGDFIADFVSQDFMAMTLKQKSKFIDTYMQSSDTLVNYTREEEIRFAITLGYLGLILEVEKYARYSIFHYGWWRNVGGSQLLFSQCFKTIESLNQ